MSNSLVRTKNAPSLASRFGGATRKHFMRLPAIFLVSAVTSSPFCARSQTTPPPSSALHQLFTEDQNDMPTKTPRTDPSPEAAKAFDERGAARRTSVRALLSRGEIKPGNDLYEAAQILQHGETAPDYLLAHVLAIDAVARALIERNRCQRRPLIVIFRSSGSLKSSARNIRSTRGHLTPSPTADDLVDEHRNPLTRRSCLLRSE